MKKIFIICTTLLNSMLYAQNGVLIGEKLNNEIESSAELEIYSTTKGVLLPRIANLASISNPVAGLLVYDNSQNSYCYFDGTGWILMPIAKFSELHDDDADTRVTVEKTNDADNIQFENGGISTAVIDNSGIDLSANTPYQIKGARIGSANTSSVFLGDNAGGATPNSSSNVMTGTNAGAGVSTGTGNVTMGYGSGTTSDFSNSVLLGAEAGKLNAANDNVFVGSQAGLANTSGTNNVFAGNTAGNDNSVGSSNILIGQNAGEGLVSGSGNIAIGAGVTFDAGASDSLKIGKIITVKDKVTFNNQYSFPNTAGTDGQTMILDADTKTLKWADAGVSAVDQTVIGSASGLYSFDFGAKGGDIQTMQRQMFLIPLVATSNASISQLMTWKKIATDELTEMALYDEDFNLLSITYQDTPPASPAVAFVSQVLITPQNVEKGKTYYIGVRSHGAYTDYAGSTVTGTFFYMDTDGNPANTTGISTNESFPAIFKDDPQGTILLPWKKYSITDRIPWVRAF